MMSSNIRLSLGIPWWTVSHLNDAEKPIFTILLELDI